MSCRDTRQLNLMECLHGKPHQERDLEGDRKDAKLGRRQEQAGCNDGDISKERRQDGHRDERKCHPAQPIAG